MSDHLRLRCWGSDWDLPSVDIDSLSVICYSKFTNAPLEIAECLPKKAITGTLPELEVQENVYSQLLRIISIFRREGYNADFNLSGDENADTLAFLAYIQQKLKPALLYTLWLDAANFTKVVRPAYASLCGFPWGMWYPSRMRQTAEHLILQSKRSFSVNGLSQIEKIVYKEAQECMNALDKKLGNRPYFFGNSPSTLDAVVYGHLGLLFKAPLVSTELKNHLLACGNLTNFCYRIERKFIKGMASPNPTTQSATGKEPLMRKDQIISIAVALGALVVYALTSGVLTARRSKLAEKLGTRRALQEAHTE